MGDDVCRVSATIPRRLLERVREFMEETGVSNRSRLICLALDSYMARLSWLRGEGSVAGNITLLYDHERGDVAKQVTHVQHRYLDLIRSSVHVHLDEHNCLETLCVVGSIERVKSLVNELEKVSGLKSIDHVLFAL